MHIVKHHEWLGREFKSTSETMKDWTYVIKYYIPGDYPQFVCEIDTGNDQVYIVHIPDWQFNGLSTTFQWL